MSEILPLPIAEKDGVLSLAQVRALIEPRSVPAGSLPRRVQVVVVGAGPAGLTAANLLGRLGIDTLLLDAKSGTAEQPRAIAIDDEYMRLIVNLGIGPSLKTHHSAPFGIWFMGADGKPVIKVEGSSTLNGFGRRSAVMQPVLEQILLAGALAHPSVRVRFGVKVDAVSQDAGGAEVRTSDGAVQADYVLACDGVRSSLRSALGIKFIGSHIDEPHLVVDLADFPDQSPFSRFFCDPRRPFNSVPSVYGGRRIEFMLKPGDDRDYLVTDEGIRELVDRHTPYKGVKLHIVRRAIYGFAEQVAERLQSGRIFLLGDAAHVMPPFGGQGMNTAARDANNLCWKIAEVLNGSASLRLLDTYDPERRPQITAIVKYSVLVGRFANVRSRPLGAIRDAFFRLVQQVPRARRFFGEMRYMPRARILQGFLAASDPQFKADIGVTFPRWTLRTGDGLTTIDELASDGFCLLGIGVTAAELRDASRHPLWDKRRPCLVIIGQEEGDGISPHVRHAEVVGISLAETERLRGRICVIRPDRYVAAIVTPPHLATAFDSLADMLA